MPPPGVRAALSARLPHSNTRALWAFALFVAVQVGDGVLIGARPLRGQIHRDCRRIISPRLFLSFGAGNSDRGLRLRHADSLGAAAELIKFQTMRARRRPSKGSG